MRHTREIESTYQMGTLVGSGGTVSGTGVDFAAWEPAARMVVSVGAASTGSVVATLEQSALVGSAYASVGTVNFAGAGTSVLEFASGQLTERYVRVTATCTGGTALTTALILGKRRTVTDA